MKKALNVLWGIWCSLVCIFSPLWMAMIYPNEKKVAWNKNRIRITSSQVSFIGGMFL